MKYDLTEKMNFDEDPILKIKDVEVTVKSDAETVLSLMDILEHEGELAALTKCLDLLFSPKDRKKIRDLHLKTADFRTLIMAASALAAGEDPDEEESDQGE